MLESSAVRCSGPSGGLFPFFLVLCFLHTRCGWEPPCYLSTYNKALSSVKLILLDVDEARHESSVAALTYSVLLVLRQ